MKIAGLDILIVDDASFIVTRLNEMLSELPYVNKVNHAGSYNQALHYLSVEKPHLILMDIQLPETSGIELLKFVKLNYPFIKNVILTNQVSKSYQDICTREGCDHFIDKSSEFEKIPSILKTYLN